MQSPLCRRWGLRTGCLGWDSISPRALLFGLRDQVCPFLEPTPSNPLTEDLRRQNVGSSHSNSSTSGAIRTRSLTLADLQITNAPTVRTFLCVPLFLIASGLQHDCHHFLFSLKKYTLPDHPLFCGIVCPHYGAECLIYLSLTYLAAPPGQVVNKTMLSCLAFIAVNLGLTAQNTKTWYMQKFGREAVQDRWLMIPYIY